MCYKVRCLAPTPFRYLSVILKSSSRGLSVKSRVEILILAYADDLELLSDNSVAKKIVFIWTSLTDSTFDADIY